MALRLVEIVLQAKDTATLRAFLKQHNVIEHSELPLLEDKVLTRILVTADSSEDILTFLGENFVSTEHNRVTVIPVEATLPRVEEQVKSFTTNKPSQERVATAELYEDTRDASACTKIYMLMVVLSTLVTSVGLYTNNVVVILGGMLIAPMLGPIIALSLSIAMGDLPLLRRALLTGLVGIGLALLLSILIGFLTSPDPTLPQIQARTKLIRGELVVAVASGCAGALAFSTGISAMLIGVMVAVSLLPPLVITGLFIGAGYSMLAQDSLLLFLMNFISVNVAGVGVFILQGIKPRDWTESTMLTKVLRIIVIGVWIFVLVAFLAYVRLHFLWLSSDA